MMVVRHFFLPTVRPSFLPREETCDATWMRPNSLALLRGGAQKGVECVREGEIGCILGNVTSLKRQRTLRGTSFIINQVMVHQCDPRPCPSPSKFHLQRTALLISSHSLRLAAKRPESKIEQNNVLSATLRM